MMVFRWVLLSMALEILFTPAWLVAQQLPLHKKDFIAWINQFQQEALEAGISQQTVDLAFNKIALLPQAIALDQKQPEFLQSFNQYYQLRITNKIISEARNLRQKNRSLLNQLYKNYGMPEQYLIAFWGLESRFSKIMGNFPVIQALATLAFEGRREKFFKAELIAALRIIDQQLIPLEISQFKGSWAGAFGGVQFIPTTFLQFAVDWDQDKKIDLWHNPQDILASAANYLSSMGWDKNISWGQEIIVPKNFPYELAETDILKPLSYWKSLGIKAADTKPFPANDPMAAVLMPMGAEGPVFLIYANFYLILKWNNSLYYALTVGILADKIVGYKGLSWGAPASLQSISFKELLLVQCYLTQSNLLSETADGKLGIKTRAAIRTLQKKLGFKQDGYPNTILVQYVSSNISDACKK